jgi:hypothetical protein
MSMTETRKIKIYSAPHHAGRKWQWWCPCCRAGGYWIYPEHWGDPDEVPPGWAALASVRNHLRERHPARLS